MRRIHACLALLLGSALARPAAAADALEVSVDCWALDADARAALEARARADLGVRGVLAGRVHVGCSPLDATLTFDAGGVHRTKSVPLAGSADARVESMLGALDELAEDSAPPPLLPPPVPESPPPALPLRPRAAESFGVSFALRGESWGSSAFALGPRGGVFVGLGRVDAVLGVGAGFAGGSLGGFTAELTDVSLGAALRLGPRDLLRLSGGAFAAFLHVTPPASLSPDAENRATPGLWARAAAALSLGPLTFSLGPELRGYLRPKTVQADGVEVFRLPGLSIGGSLESSVRF